MRFTDLLLADTLCTQDRGFFLRFRAQNRGLLFTLGHKDLAVFFALCTQDGFAAFALGLHLFFHRVLDLARRQDIFQLDPVDLDPPFVGCDIQRRGDLGVDDITGSQGAVQLHLADDVAQGGCGQVFDRRHRALDPVGVELGIGHLIKDNRINLHGNIVLGDYRLGREVDYLFLHGHLFGNPVDERHLDMQPGLPGGIIAAEALDHIDTRLRDDLDVRDHDDQHKQHNRDQDWD